MVPLIYLWIQYMMYGLDPIRIAPFGYLRIISCLPIPAAFRSLPRPSSAPDAKASSLRSYQLNLLSHRIMSHRFNRRIFEIVIYPRRAAFRSSVTSLCY